MHTACSKHQQQVKVIECIAYGYRDRAYFFRTVFPGIG
jgi:hypothetical protein